MLSVLSIRHCKLHGDYDVGNWILLRAVERHGSSGELPGRHKDLE